MIFTLAAGQLGISIYRTFRNLYRSSSLAAVSCQIKFDGKTAGVVGLIRFLVESVICAVLFLTCLPTVVLWFLRQFAFASSCLFHLLSLGIGRTIG